jgi:prepilin-type N-terminal cleavage/methylation domain-containing protein
MHVLHRLRSRCRSAGDAGLGLVEVLVAITVFAIIATAVAIGLQSALNATRQDRLRVQAAHLAARELDLARHEFTTSATGVADLSSSGSVTNPHPLTPGTATGGTPAPLTVDGVPFTLTRFVQWVPVGTAQSQCDGGSAVGFPVLSLNVKVTWPDMRGVKPVESNTLLTPPKRVVSGTSSYIAVKVVGAAGTGQAGVPVQLSGAGTSMSAVTADDGCAVFQVTPSYYPQSYDLTAAKAGWVDYYGNPTGVRTTTVTAAGTLVRPAPISYDQQATLVATMALDPSDAAAGYQLPTALPPYSLYNSGLVTDNGFTRQIASSGATTTMTGLWPFVSGYESWPGWCDSAGSGHPPATVVQPGSTTTVVHRMVPLSVTVARAATGPAPSGVQVVATPVDPTGCSAAENPLQLGATDNHGVLLTSLPAGSWQISVVGSGSTVALVADLSAASDAQSVQVSVP